MTGRQHRRRSSFFAAGLVIGSPIRSTLLPTRPAATLQAIDRGPAKAISPRRSTESEFRKPAHRRIVGRIGGRRTFSDATEAGGKADVVSGPALDLAGRSTPSSRLADADSRPIRVPAERSGPYAEWSHAPSPPKSAIQLEHRGAGICSDQHEANRRRSAPRARIEPAKRSRRLDQARRRPPCTCNASGCAIVQRCAADQPPARRRDTVSARSRRLAFGAPRHAPARRRRQGTAQAVPRGAGYLTGLRRPGRSRRCRP